ncbi:hypothetical protein EDB85DRAFT_2223491 [Lactarius pseudohatsudake]|nr:hypothetical protein EDB85DRAFT_2223491 [Lactarius pseudohatsudake]
MEDEDPLEVREEGLRRYGERAEYQDTCGTAAVQTQGFYRWQRCKQCLPLRRDIGCVGRTLAFDRNLWCDGEVFDMCSAEVHAQARETEGWTVVEGLANCAVTLGPADAKQKQRVLARCRAGTLRATIVGALRRVAWDKGLYGREHASPFVPAQDDLYIPEEVSAQGRGASINEGMIMKSFGLRLSRMERRERRGSVTRGGGTCPGESMSCHAVSTSSKHRTSSCGIACKAPSSERSGILSPVVKCVMPARSQPGADVSEGFEFEVAKGNWEVNWAGVQYAEVESLEWGQTAKAVEYTEDVVAEAGKAEGAYPQAGRQEQLQGSEQFETANGGSNFHVDTHRERGRALHHRSRPKDGQVRGDGRPEFGLTECS